LEIDDIVLFVTPWKGNASNWVVDGVAHGCVTPTHMALALSWILFHISLVKSTIQMCTKQNKTKQNSS
jgi:hypothetical protein